MKPIKIYDSFKLKETEEKNNEKAKQEKKKTRKNRHVSDAGHFMIADKSEVKSPLLQNNDEENEY